MNSETTPASSDVSAAGSEPWRDEEIRPVVLPLPGFQYHHATREPEVQEDRGMVGRDDLLSELVSVLQNTRDSRGSYLVAGFRGAGKTALINTALSIYNGNSDHLGWIPRRRRSRNEANAARLGPEDLACMLRRGRAELRQRQDADPDPPDCFRSVQVRIEKMLRGYFGMRVALNDWASNWRRLSRPLVPVAINLATEQCLDARTVLYNAALRLHQVLFEAERNVVRFLRSVALSVLLFLLLVGGIHLAIWLYQLLREVPILGGLLVLIPDGIDALGAALGGMLRGLATLVFGADKTNAAVQVMDGGTWQAFGHAFAGFVLPAGLTYWLWFHRLQTPERILRRLRGVLRRGQQTEETDQGLDAGAGIRFGRRFTTPPLNAHQIEAELLDILRTCRDVPPLFGRPDVVFVFDELDKIAGIPQPLPGARDAGATAAQENSDARHPIPAREVYRRKERVDDLLATIKNFITEAQARFFFIAGREMLDSYQAERGNASSLYESLFNRVFEVPSLLTDPSWKPRGRIARMAEAFVCRRLLSPGEATYLWWSYQRALSASEGSPRLRRLPAVRAIQYQPYTLRTVYHMLVARGVDAANARRSVFMLRHLVHFLALHSWGNCKRMNSLFEHFLKPRDIADWANARTEGLRDSYPAGVVSLALQLGRIDQQRIMLASNLFVLVQHHLRRQHTSNSDKLAVSVFAALQYLLKFHRFPFVRSQLDRMDEVLSIHRSPELNTSIDTLLTLVLKPHLRLIRNGLGRYRFIHAFEQEVRYISRTSDIESAAFNFSLDATAGVKQHYQELLREAMPADTKGEGWETGVSSRADIHIALGDLLAQEESFDQAAIHFAAAAGCLAGRLALDDAGRLQVPDLDLAATDLLQYVEAMLKLGDVHERRQRYERAAAAYAAARRVAAAAVSTSVDEGTPAGATSGPEEGRYLGFCARIGDSKWDVLKQPLWAQRFLSLKRSPMPWAENCIPPPLPFYACPTQGETGALAATDPVFHLRAGNLAFFYGRHGTAARHFVAAIACSNPGRLSEDSERRTFVGGYAALNLAETLLLAFLRHGHARMRERLRGRARERAGVLDAETREHVRRLSRLIGTLAPVREHWDLIDAASRDGLLDLSQLNAVAESVQDQGPNSAPGNPAPGALTIDQLDLRLVFGAMVAAARRFERHGLNYHASFAYLKLLSLWACLIECIPFSLLHEQGRAATLDKRSVQVIQDSTGWVEKIRVAAMRTALAVNGSAFLDAWYKIWYSDIPGWPPSSGGIDQGRLTPPWKSLQPFAPPPGQREIPLLFVTDCDQSEERVCIPERCETPAWYSSFMYQKLVFVTLWQQVLCRHFKAGELAEEPKFDMPATGQMVPSAVRSLLFAHWIRGRTLTWRVVREARKAAQMDAGSPADNVIDGLYRKAALAGHNLYRAHFYIRQMCGNDQDLMFPAPAMVLYSLWRLIHSLVDMEIRRLAKAGGGAAEGGDSTPAPGHYPGALRDVRRRLYCHSDRATPGNYFDYEFVSERVVTTLMDLEQLSDLSSRARAEVLKGKYFLADDYEDPRFHLDWTMLQMTAPTAALVREHVIVKRDELRGLAKERPAASGGADKPEG